MSGWMNKWMERWMDGRMDGQWRMDGWMNGWWTDGWMDRQMDIMNNYDVALPMSGCDVKLNQQPRCSHINSTGIAVTF